MGFFRKKKIFNGFLVKKNINTKKNNDKKEQYFVSIDCAKKSVKLCRLILI